MRRDLQWVKEQISSTEAVNEKLLNYPYVKLFCDTLEEYDSISYKIFHYKYAKATRLLVTDPLLLYASGLPNFNMFRMTPGGNYIIKNTMCGIWKNFDTYSDILTFFNKQKNSKFQQNNIEVTFDKPYIFFPLQAVAKDYIMYEHILQMLSWSKETQNYVLFKPHPIHQQATVNTWKELEKRGFISKYSVLVEEANALSLAKHAKAVIASDSSLTFNAMLCGIPSATLLPTQFQEIIPVISSLNSIHDIKVPPMSDILRFLSWYYHKLVIDLDSNTYIHKIRTIIDLFCNQHKDFNYIFSQESPL